ncbi:hypothetical protein KOI35_43505 [Actinoplanes bogorensis]|uniref:DUF5666 domain-containing protein n=1 Tax=Paractinoplanes bogorensis TaxID=1610840 RepID=A0ABS5Z3X5_9ACTN|nr:hypothetical protein [Actinoplanes bogorensis]MBU2670391.1 hypothetical protein [Actinoplanes bogorensis]
MRLNHRAALVAAVALAGLATASPALAADKSTVSVGGANPVSVGVSPSVSVGNGVNANLGSGGNATVGTVLPFAAAGSVASVAPKSITVKNLTLDAKTPTSTYPVADNAKVSLDGRAVALAALPAGARIVVLGTVSNGSTYSATYLAAMSRWSLNLNGTVSAVDAAKGTVTVNNGKAAVNLNVDPKASVQVNGVKADLSKLPVGATVNLTGTDSIAGANVLGITANAAGVRR